MALISRWGTTRTRPDVYSGIELSLVSCMIVIEHLVKVGIVARSKGLIQHAVKGLAREGGHAEFGLSRCLDVSDVLGRWTLFRFLFISKLCGGLLGMVFAGQGLSVNEAYPSLCTRSPSDQLPFQEHWSPNES
jgi:hypothetical protein